MDNLSFIAIAAQLLFGARMLLQWLSSERAKRVVTPLSFWWLSLSGALTLLTYGLLRLDFPLMLGQIFAYFIYVRNLQINKQWKRLPLWSQVLIYGVPIAVLIVGYLYGNLSLASLFTENDMPLWLLVLGITAQVLFTLRYVYQWVYAERTKLAILPLGFWWLSFIGGVLSFLYFTARVDYILMLSYGLGTVIYSRNIYLYYKSKR